MAASNKSADLSISTSIPQPLAFKAMNEGTFWLAITLISFCKPATANIFHPQNQTRCLFFNGEKLNFPSIKCDGVNNEMFPPVFPAHCNIMINEG